MELFYYYDHDLLLDFNSIRKRVKSIPESTLYKILKRKCPGIVRYQNKILYRYSNLLELPELYKEIKNYEI